MQYERLTWNGTYKWKFKIELEKEPWIELESFKTEAKNGTLKGTFNELQKESWNGNSQWDLKL